MKKRRDVFVSYATSDLVEFIRPVITALTDRGVTYWLDADEISLADEVALRINEGLSESRFVLVCFSERYLNRPWPETELNAALAIQNATGVKRIIPLILNSKNLIIEKYPLYAGLRHLEFSLGPAAIADEIAKLVQSLTHARRTIRIEIHSPYSGRSFEILAEFGASVRWLRDQAQRKMEVPASAPVGASTPFHFRWVLVESRAKAQWDNLPVSTRLALHALVNGSSGLIQCNNEFDTLREIGAYDGVIFYLYAVQDHCFPSPVATPD